MVIVNRPARPTSSSVPVRNHGDRHRRGAARHVAKVLQDEAPAPAIQRARDLFQSHVSRRAFDSRPGAEHVPLARAGDVALKLLVEKRRENGPPPLSGGWGLRRTSNVPRAVMTVLCRVSARAAVPARAG